MKNATSVVGWLLLAAVLAVPSFLFYNWLSKSKLQNQAELANEPVAGSVFPSERKGVQAPAAGQPSTAPARQAMKADEPKAAPQASGQAGQPGAPSAETRPQAGQPAEPAPSASANPPAAAPRPAQEPGLSTAAQQGAGQVAVSTGPKPVSYFDPKGTRDPTYSPDDYRRIKEERLQREEAERQRLLAEKNRPREPGPESRISLQGIVGSAAIINGDMYSAGQTVRGVKILKIGADYIIAEYKGKKFKKVLK